MNPLVLAGLLLALSWTWIYRRWTGPPELTRRSSGHLLELLLYADSPRLLGRVLLDLAGSSLALARQLLRPSLAAAALLLLALGLLQGYVHQRPVRVGEPFLVAARAVSGAGLEHDGGLRLDSSPLPSQGRLYWRLVANSEGSHRITLEQGAPAHVQVTAGWASVQARQGSLQIFYPERQFWLGDRRITWETGLLGSVCCWLVLVWPLSHVLQRAQQLQ